MAPINAATPAPAGAGYQPRIDRLASAIGPTDTLPARVTQAPLRAELSGDDSCTACGLTVRGAAPVLALCRRLIEADHDPATPLHAYRGDVVALTVRSIGEGAALDVSETGVGFRRARRPSAAPPKRQNERAARVVPGAAGRAGEAVA
jgi:hypothetical protein